MIITVQTETMHDVWCTWHQDDVLTQGHYSLDLSMPILSLSAHDINCQTHHAVVNY